MTAEIHFLPTEGAILAMLQQGDERGLVHVYKQSRGAVHGYVLRNNGTPDDAEDVLQEAVVVLWERVRAGTYEHTAKVETFIVAVAKNIWLRRLSRKRREIPGDPVVMDAVQDEGSTPLEELMQDEETAHLAASLDKLGEPCRTLLVLYYYEERSMEEIARLMGFANADTVKSKKYQCKKTLEKVFAHS